MEVYSLVGVGGMEWRYVIVCDHSVYSGGRCGDARTRKSIERRWQCFTSCKSELDGRDDDGADDDDDDDRTTVSAAAAAARE